MTEIDRELVDKYFKNVCSQEEASEVLNWFRTDEGRQFLHDKLESDSKRVNDKRVKVLIRDIDSAKMYREIARQTEGDNSADRLRFRVSDVTLRMLQTAAVLLVMLVSAWFTTSVMNRSETIVEIRSQVTEQLYETSVNEIRDLLLSDGTRVRLNEQSSLAIVQDSVENTRKVRLEGEAYFDVERMPDKPFIVVTEGAEIEVLGTAFNVNSHQLTSEEIQVSVIEGKVRFRTEPNADNAQSILVEAGQFGVLNTGSNQFLLNDQNPVNYLYWMSRRIEYTDDSLEVACDQMNRIYGYECRFDVPELMNERFTSTFSENGIEKFISVISLTLDIEPEVNSEEKIVVWSYN
ncbi:MAG: FecR domain-containing protein [Balneolaceae bacterium]